MRHVSLREFRTRGSKAIGEIPAGETTLLVGQNGPAYFLVPVRGNVIQEERELRRAIAKTSLRDGWARAEQIGPLSDDEIDAEIAAARATQKPLIAKRQVTKRRLAK